MVRMQDIFSIVFTKICSAVAVVNYLVDFYLCWIIKNPAELRQVLGNRHLFRPPHRSNLGKKKRVPLDVCWLEI